MSRAHAGLDVDHGQIGIAAIDPDSGIEDRLRERKIGSRQAALLAAAGGRTATGGVPATGAAAAPLRRSGCSGRGAFARLFEIVPHLRMAVFKERHRVADLFHLLRELSGFFGGFLGLAAGFIIHQVRQIAQIEEPQRART